MRVKRRLLWYGDCESSTFLGAYKNFMARIEHEEQEQQQNQHF